MKVYMRKIICEKNICHLKFYLPLNKDGTTPIRKYEFNDKSHVDESINFFLKFFGVRGSPSPHKQISGVLHYIILFFSST